MSYETVGKILCVDDGSLPDINVDFGHQPMVGDAYALIQGRATHLASDFAYYWSRSKSEECAISFGENPALALLAGEAEPFHVVFGGLRSAHGASIPDLGVFVLDDDFIALDYRMGPHWDQPAILGLFEIMRDLKALASSATISHTGNIFETDEEILLSAFHTWSIAPGYQVDTDHACVNVHFGATAAGIMSLPPQQLSTIGPDRRPSAAVRRANATKEPALADILITPDESGYYCLTGELQPETMGQLAQLSALQPLKISITKIPQFGIGHARCLAGLRVEQLWIWCDVTRAAMNHILQLEGLRELDILSMSGPGKLKNFHKAVQLDVFRANHYMTEPDLLQVAQCPSIRVLGAQNADLARSAFAALLRMPNLAALDLEATRFDDKMAKQISRSTTVSSLDVGGTRLTRVGLAHLMKMTQLHSLDLWALDLNATDLTMLLALPNLEYVSFGGNDNAPPLDAAAITTLILESRSLKRVWLDGVRLERGQQEALEAKLEWLYLSD